MPIQVSQIAVGQCYVTPAGQVRRVLVHSGGKVRYESRGKKATTFTNQVTAKETTFAKAVERQVACDFDPNFGSQ